MSRTSTKRQRPGTIIEKDELLSAQPPVRRTSRQNSLRSSQVEGINACCENNGAACGQASRDPLGQAAPAESHQTSLDNTLASLNGSSNSQSENNISSPEVKPKASEKKRGYEFKWQGNGRLSGHVDSEGRYCYKIGSTKNCAWRVSIDGKLYFIVTGE